MSIRVVYLASLRERAGISEELVVVPAEIGTVDALVGWLRARGGPVASVFADTGSVRAAVNQRFARPGAPVTVGDEVAFFPPVTGG